jgi:hypothetical protein
MAELRGLCKEEAEEQWESLLISMGRTIPNGLMICKCTFTGFTLLFGRLWL